MLPFDGLANTKSCSDTEPLLDEILDRIPLPSFSVERRLLLRSGTATVFFVLD